MNKIKYLVLLFGVAAGLTLPSLAAELGAQKSSDLGVTVAVTPQSLSEDAKSWDFKVVLDTHSQNLSDDLLRTTFLLAGNERLTPVAWEGAPPGGHHREGTLRFTPVKPLPQSIELQMQRPGETAPRTFRWNLR